jgi:hypothetical protein
MGMCRRMKRNVDDDKWDKYFKFAFVRNPWDRMVSAWKNRSHTYESFKDFVKAYPYPEEKVDLIWHTMPQLTHICDDRGEYMVNHIGRFENLQHDFELICSALDMPKHKLPHKNKTTHHHYTHYYDDETIERVASNFSRDIERLNYKYGV